MKMPTTSLFPRKASALLVALLALTAAAQLRAQTVFLTFSGGNGSEVTITWSTPISYTLTSSSSGVNPIFVFRSVANSQTIFPVQAVVGGVAPTYTSTGAGSTDGTQTVNRFKAPNTFNSVTAGDVVFFATLDAAPTFLTAGDVITLSAGSLRYNGTTETSAGYNGVLPANGSYTTFITAGADTFAGNLGSGSAIPEPSTYAAFAGLAALGFVVWRRRRNIGPAAQVPC